MTKPTTYPCALNAEGIPTPTELAGSLGYRCVPLPSAGSHAAHLFEFDPARFCNQAYALAGLEMPAQIARSVQRRQSEFFFGRLGARRALDEYGAGSTHIAIGPQREPLWPSGFIGSITHSTRHAAAVVLPRGRWHGVGIDLETAVAPAAQRDVETVALCAREQQLLRSLNRQDYASVLALAFGAKESFYKAVCAAAGGFFGFEAIELDEWDFAAGRIRFTLTESVCDAWPRGSVGHVNFVELGGGLVLTSFLW